MSLAENGIDDSLVTCGLLFMSENIASSFNFKLSVSIRFIQGSL